MGTFSQPKFPDTSQRPISQAGLSTENGLSAAMWTLFCIRLDMTTKLRCTTLALFSFSEFWNFILLFFLKTWKKKIPFLIPIFHKKDFSLSSCLNLLFSLYSHWSWRGRESELTAKFGKKNWVCLAQTTPGTVLASGHECSSHGLLRALLLIYLPNSNSVLADPRGRPRAPIPAIQVILDLFCLVFCCSLLTWSEPRGKEGFRTLESPQRPQQREGRPISKMVHISC